MTTPRTLITVPLDLLLTVCESIYHNPNDNPGDPRIRPSHRHRLPAAIAELAEDWIAPDGIHSATAAVDVVEIHAETLIAVAAVFASMGSDDAAEAAAEIRAFVAAANGDPERTGPDDPADLNPELGYPTNGPACGDVRNENGSHR